MRIDWLEDLLAVVESGSLSEAANARLLTQPAFSRRVRTLEDRLGFEIVDRDRKPARPTNALLQHEGKIRELAASLRLLIADVKREARQGSNRIVIGSQHAITMSLAPAIIKALGEKERTQIRLRSVNRDECHALLLSRQADLILTYRMADEPPRASADFTEELLIGTEDLIAVFDASAAEALTRRPPEMELPVIAYPADVFLGEIFNQLILSKIEPQAVIWPVAETALTLAALQLSKAAVGIAWVPASLAAAEIALGNLADLRNQFPSASMNIIATRLSGAKSPLEANLWDVLAEGLDGLSAGATAGPGQSS